MKLLSGYLHIYYLIFGRNFPSNIQPNRSTVDHLHMNLHDSFITFSCTFSPKIA